MPQTRNKIAILLPSLVLVILVWAIFVFKSGLNQPKQINKSFAALSGDCNQDSKVDILDFQLLSNSFGKSSGQNGYNAKCDFNSDSKIDVLDFQLMSNNFGRTSVTATPKTTSTPTPVVTNIPGRQVVVSTSVQLANAISSASPGDVITATAGTYTGSYNITKSGSSSSPIIIRSQNQSAATLSNTDIRISGNYIQISNFEITGKGIFISGSHNRISRNYFHNSSGSPAVDIQGSASYNRVDFNEITNWNDFGVRITNTTNGLTGNRIDHNYIHHNLSVSYAEAINLGGGRDSSLLNFGTLVEYNLLDHIATDEESEIISIKSSGNTVQFNTFRDSEDLFVNIRHGQNDKFISNYLINENMQTQGDNHEVIGNFITGGDIRLRAGDCIEPQVPTGGGCHPAARYNLVAKNTVQGGKIYVGDSNPIPATDNHLASNNASIDTSGNQKGTIIDQNYSGNPGNPVLLTPQMVGINAPGN